MANRTILFRGIPAYIETDDFVFGSLLIRENRYFIVDETGAETEIIPGTAGQFTGLTDCNGKRIFEDDIVTAKSEGLTVTNGIISYGQGPCRFFITNLKHSFGWNLAGDKNNQETCEVKGHIFQK